MGELEIGLEAPSRADLFVEAARALAEALAGGLPEAVTEPERIALGASDVEALLVDFLNELVYLGEREGVAYTDVRVERVTDRELFALARGAPLDRPRLAVKAATLHGLRLREDASGATATVILDV